MDDKVFLRINDKLLENIFTRKECGFEDTFKFNYSQLKTDSHPDVSHALKSTLDHDLEDSLMDTDSFDSNTSADNSLNNSIFSNKDNACYVPPTPDTNFGNNFAISGLVPNSVLTPIVDVQCMFLFYLFINIFSVSKIMHLLD